MNDWTPDDIAMASVFIVAAVVITLIATGVFVTGIAAVLSRTYLAGRKDGLREGQIVGELAEHRRRDEMNVRARKRAEDELLSEILHGGSEFTEDEIDV
jgi:hypothetical protein